MADATDHKLDTSDRKLVAQQLVNMVSSLLSRQDVASRLGSSFEGQRDLYKVLGYKKSVDFQDYQSLYERGDIAQRIVDAPPISTWRRRPTVANDSDPSNFTPFESAWASIVKKRRVFHYLERADRLAGIGQYGVLLLGTADVRKQDDMERPMARLKGPDGLLYLAPFAEDSAEIKTVDTDPSSLRFGLPETYSITVAASGDLPSVAARTQKMTVHHTRVIHIAENLLEDEIYGTPRLKHVFNRLFDVEKIAGGSAEIFWQAAKRIMILQAKDGFSAVDGDDELTQMMDELIHGLRRVIDVQGYEVKTLDPTDVKPREAFDVCLALVSSATGIPQRILLGSEQGKMASTQDEVNWNGRIADRQLNFAEPVILRPFIDRLIDARILPIPEKDYIITWPSLFELSDKEKAQIALLKTRALAQYIGKAGENVKIASSIIPVEEFRGEILNMRAPKVEITDATIGGQADNPEGSSPSKIKVPEPEIPSDE